MDYNARMYSPALGRFIQPDTIVPDMFNPQSLNRYSYVMNNPIRYTDPSGHYCEDEVGNKQFNCNKKLTLPPIDSSGCGVIMSCLPLTHNSITIILNPTHVDEQGNIIIAVPVQQPNGSPSVPTITTMSTTQSSTSTTIIDEVIPDTQGFGWDPAIDPFWWNPFPVDPNFTYDGKPLDDLTLDAVRETTLTTSTTVNLVTVDQYGGVIGTDEYSYSNSASVTEYNYGGTWSLTRPIPLDPWSQSVK